MIVIVVESIRFVFRTQREEQSRDVLEDNELANHCSSEWVPSVLFHRQQIDESEQKRIDETFLKI